MNVNRAADLAQPLFDVLGDFQILAGIAAGDLNVDRRQRAEVEDLGNDVGRLEIEYRVRVGFVQDLAQGFAVGAGRSMAFPK
jgi:hypothetical protein